MIGGSAMHVACEEGRLADVRYLVKKLNRGVDPRDRNGQTPLFWAASSNQTAVVRFLLKKGADANATDRQGSSALFRPSGKGFLSVVRLLVEKGKADINQESKRGKTALGVAAEAGRNATAAYLRRKRGGRPNRRVRLSLSAATLAWLLLAVFCVLSVLVCCVRCVYSKARNAECLACQHAV